jgi:hypothetical protein
MYLAYRLDLTMALDTFLKESLEAIVPAADGRSRIANPFRPEE